MNDKDDHIDEPENVLDNFNNWNPELSLFDQATHSNDLIEFCVMVNPDLGNSVARFRKTFGEHE